MCVLLIEMPRDSVNAVFPPRIPDQKVSSETVIQTLFFGVDFGSKAR